MGDIVQLKSGGPAMTFVRYTPYGLDLALMTHEGLQQIVLPACALMHCEATATQQQNKETRLEAFLKAAEREASALERIAAAIEKIAGCVGPR